ncbi:SdiA-regulated domain-containing protein [Pseudomonas sp. N040]|uniref:SdiA-regulated domain-containing protein n=1 Tax=Pseudomonas sp. N040 TaxID=2785325 RepID=UPI0018A2C775|nr:SdiA-regulated domain-containing protein [Pseudomonas sp. N040]MBF7730020.1 SdiA-regulated domain-containing protein [Pseudomonas sp. N040]MBW7013662.1 SdiA-regulated domain-containing protein [Pseudomonas sp. N040]
MSLTLRRCVIVLLTLLLVLAGYLMRWDARVLLWWQESQSSAEQQAANLWLPGYQAVAQLELPGYEKEEFSGLAYSAESDSLFAVSGKTPLLLELSREGRVLRRIELKGSANLEGVAVLGDGYMAVADERQHRLSIFRIDAATRTVEPAQYLQQIDLGYAEDSNKGFEGLAWDARNQRFLLGKEKHPVQLFSLPAAGYRVSGPLQALTDLGGIMTDLAGLAVDPRSGHVLALSQESHLLVELGQDLQPSNFIALLRGLHGLQHYIPQAEGVALDRDGNLYLVSERNLFYVFRKQPGAH